MWLVEVVGPGSAFSLGGPSRIVAQLPKASAERDGIEEDTRPISNRRKWPIPSVDKLDFFNLEWDLLDDHP